MATAGNIVQRAFREGNLKPAGKSPTDTEQSEALQYLTSFIQNLFRTTIARRLMDWTTPNIQTAPRDARYPLYPRNQSINPDKYPYPPANVRLTTRLTGPQTIYLQQYPTDGALIQLVNVGPEFGTHPLTLDANGFLIEGQDTLVFDTDPSYNAPIMWMFRADKGSWERLVFPLTADAEMPFPEEFDDFFVASLNIRMAPTYGKQVHPVTAAIATEGAANIEARYFQDTPDANMLEPDLFTAESTWGLPYREDMPYG